MIAPQPLGHQFVARRLLSLFAFLIFIASLPLVLIRLGSMQLEGIPQLALASVAIGIGYTSLLYGRARALEDGPWRRRSIVAAEKALRAVLMHIFSIALGVVLFAQLSACGYEARQIDWKSKRLMLNLETLPAFLAFVPIVLVAWAALMYYGSLRCLLHRGLLSLGFENMSSRHKRFFMIRSKRLIASSEDTQAKTQTGSRSQAGQGACK